MRLFGLVGFPLSHSFSASYFAKKFTAENISDADYQLFPMESITSIRLFIKQHVELQGFNITIPHKVAVITYLDHISAEAKAIGAVNCVKIERNRSKIELTGYNTDTYGFRNSLVPHLKPHHRNALVLGTGGGSKAVSYTLEQMGIKYTLVSRTSTIDSHLLYDQLTKNILSDNLLIINTTPVGQYPDIEKCPDIPYQFLSDKHLLFDLVYNPTETLFLKRGREAGAVTLNGLPMLTLQAEKSWEIWNS